MKNIFKRLIISTSLVFTFMFTGIIDVNAVVLGSIEQIQIKDYRDDTTDNIDVRFVGDIPYVRLTDMYSYLFSESLTISVVEPGVYEVTANEESAIINTNTDTLYAEDYSSFIEEPGDDDEKPKMIKNFRAETVGDALETTINFANYNIDLVGDGTDLWMPAATVIDMFMQMGFYDGNIINIIDSSDENFSKNNEYKTKLAAMFNNQERNDEFLAQSYNELCFVFDTFYGYPDSNSFSSLLKEHGLDYTLSNYSDETRLVKSWLLSDDLVEYYAGLTVLNSILYDGGHTNLIDTFAYDFILEAFPDLSDESRELYKDLEIYENRDFSSFVTSYKIEEARTNAMGTDRYMEQGDTAIFSFDEFDFDMQGWSNFYDNGGDYPDDTLGNILRALDRAKENPNIKNFVFDISSNGGGTAFVAPLIMNYLGFKNGLREKNMINSQIAEIIFDVDTNFDGVYDAKDNVSKYNFNYGVLTSSLTFSTANLFTSLARDNGFAILGEKSSGGACSVKSLNTSEGVMYSISVFSHSVNKNNETVDFGYDPDYILVENVDGRINYDKFYNLGILSELLNDFYNNEEPIDNPSTSDNIMKYISILEFSFIGLVGTGIYIKKYC